jgi:DNA polymerase I-like protein with 3'-5' exonuclease and polymerase domains
MEIIVLKHQNYKKGKENAFFYSKIIGGEIKKHKDLSFLDDGKYSSLISFDFGNIINDINDISNLTFIDVEEIKKQLTGKSKNEFKKNERPWDIWHQIRKSLKFESFEEINKQIIEFKKNYYGLDDQVSVENIKLNFDFLLITIDEIYTNLIVELNKKFEFDRYNLIEKEINTILIERTKEGIRIDETKINGLIKELNIELYQIKNELQLKYRIFSKNDFLNIARNLEKDYPELIESLGTNDFYKDLKLFKEESNLLKLLYDERKVATNKSILSRIGSLDGKRVFPHFSSFGTVTSRILVDSPSFQQLSKKYRNIILNDDDKELIYIDYCQFEAGILASESNDPKLIDMYNNQDIYTQLSIAIFGDELNRNKSKLLFFAYCYGMSIKNINQRFGKEKLDIFFNQFPNLDVFRKKINDDFIKHKFINTSMGNHRYMSSKNFENEVESWVISQKIQGNASLILKKAILNIYEIDKEIEFLLPMHDAVLYQIPKGKKEEKKIILEKAFKTALKDICPLLEPKVEFKNFFES